jgi:hypothetical protein
VFIGDATVGFSMWPLLVIGVSAPLSTTRPGPVTSKQLKPHTDYAFRITTGTSVVFFDLSGHDKQTYDLSLNTSAGLATRTNCNDRFVFVAGDSFSIRPHRHLSILIWQIPASFCASTFYAISADGELTGTLLSLPSSGPLCLFSHPFVSKYQMSSLIGEPHLSGNLVVEYYVDSLRHAFSTCEMGIGCMFLHTQPFLLRVAWKNGTHFDFKLKYQTGSMRHSDRPCFLGPIPDGRGNTFFEADAFGFECQDKEEQEHSQFVIVMLTVVAFLVLAMTLHAAGVVNMRVVLGCEDENLRFEKMKQDLEMTRTSWPSPFFAAEDDPIP